jgi:alkylated DNA repair dioxygenase AlkB
MQAPVTYWPNFIQRPDEIYSALINLPWQRHRMSFGCLVPRDEVWIAPYPYKYGGRLYPAYDGWTPELLTIKELVEDKTGVQYDSVLCNQYRSGKDSVAYHCDCEAEMSSVHPIASVSLGAERVFQMKSKDSRFTEKMTLGNGSLLIMQAGMQTTWEHAVPKTAKNIGGRINLTFRVMVTDS